MLKEFITSITGAATTSAYTNPSGYGISGVSPGASFKNFFGSILSSFGNTPTAIFGGTPQGFGGTPQGFGGIPQGFNGTPNSAVNAYRNVQSGFIGGYPGSQIINDGSFKGRKLKAQALAPGSVVINSLANAPAQGQISQPLGFAAAFPNQLAGLTPLQGNATGQGIPFGAPQAGFSQVPFGQPAPFAPNGFAQGGFSGLSLLIMPIIGLFSMVKSLLGFRREVNSLTPVQVDTQDLNYFDSQNSYGEFERQEGSFDEYFPEDFETNSFDIRKLEEGI